MGQHGTAQLSRLSDRIYPPQNSVKEQHKRLAIYARPQGTSLNTRLSSLRFSPTADSEPESFDPKEAETLPLRHL